VSSVVARAAVVAVAVAVLSWLGVMERGVRLQASGVAAAQRGDYARADADFRAARLLTPDTLPDVRRAFVFQGTGRTREAVAVIEDVVRREPHNLGAWRLLYEFTRERDPATSRRALAAIRRLDPLNAARR
jgi:hypothetical protein